MKTTIKALRQFLEAAEAFTDPEGNMPADTGEFNDLKACIPLLREAIAREEAQTVEPTAWISPAMLEVLLTHPSGHTVLCGRRTSPGRTIPLFTHPAQPPSSEQDANVEKLEVLMTENGDARAAHARKQALEEAIQACRDAEEPGWTGYECPNTFNDGKYAAEAAIKELLK